MQYFLGLVVSIGLPLGALAQAVQPVADSSATQYVVIGHIEVLGLKHTKEAVVRRELPFHTGDTILLANLPRKLEEGQLQLMNTGLFTQAQISCPAEGGHTQGVVALRVQLQESWYIYPVPLFELADRNFNVWWVEQGRSLERINLGLEFTHENLTGWRDRLKTGFKYGYTRSLNLSYRFPYLNRARTVGVGVDLSLAGNREVNYATEADKQLFFQDEDAFVYRRFALGVGFSYRRRLYGSHQLNLAYRLNRLDERVARELNPGFFGAGRTQQRYFSLNYNYSLDRRDMRPYPWRGFLLAGGIEKDGLGIFNDRTALTLRGRAEGYLPWRQRWSIGLRAAAKWSAIRSAQPYNDNRALGFGGNFVNGYEYYIIDGLDMALLKASLRWRVLDKSLYLGKLVPLEAFRTLPLRMYLAAHADWGFVNAPFSGPGNRLPNRSLWGGGPSLDVVLYYDIVLKFHYSFNDLGERGFFLHLDLGI